MDRKALAAAFPVTVPVLMGYLSIGIAFGLMLERIGYNFIWAFFMSLTMSMDDFVVTYFTKGAGINTLSTMIYGQIRKGIKPEMYALSTIIFAIILVILILVNFVPEIAEKRRKRG